MTLKNPFTSTIQLEREQKKLILQRKLKKLSSSVYISDGSFLKLDNVTLSYSLRDAGVFSSLRFYTTASNLLTITGYDGIDPEVAGGIDNNQYPRSRTFLMGISANF